MDLWDSFSWQALGISVSEAGCALGIETSQSCSSLQSYWTYCWLLSFLQRP